ncbi:MAG TPA: chromate resistance protein ChrB domain-containing protein [Actinomycetota bacterium]|nr:chromate resistance protein ChrB domain-containing protein [Actinomycetota bacterium]
MKWVTRARPKTDRIACPWLIRRSIDPEAEFHFVPADDVLPFAEREGAVSFDAPGARYTHRGDLCTFEVLIEDHGMQGSDPALDELARIVHAADIAGEEHTHPFGATVSALGSAGLDVEDDDLRLLERGLFLYDALYAWCRKTISS